MKTDIASRTDIAAVVNAFYTRVKINPVIGHFFTDVVNVNWEKHLPVMYDFWEGIVFGVSGYSGNPVNKHRAIHALHAFTTSDLEEWTRLFQETVDEMYEGEKATLMKQRAVSIAVVMQLKVVYNNPF